MAESDNKTTFDRLVSGLSAEDRSIMLQKINHNSTPSVQLVDNNIYTENDSTLHLKFVNESFFYKIILWFRSLLNKKTSEQIYSEDVLMKMAKRVSRDHPGLINPQSNCLDSLFFELLKQLRSAAEFFRPYLQDIDTNPGEFYVFLSSFVAPKITESINSEADPFINPFTKDDSNEVKVELLRKLDSILTDMPSDTKANMYAAVTSINWLQNFCKLPYLHFVAQFTNIVGDSYTCPYKNAKSDFDVFSSVFTNISTPETESLEALFLYSTKRSLNERTQNKDIEKSVKEFLSKANTNLALIQMFLSSVPVVKLGKIINRNYDWLPDSMPGAEAWFNHFRTQWRKVIEIRWKEWLRERKKQLLGNNLRLDFQMEEFPSMFYEPWKECWTDIHFTYELSGGFISWYAMNKYGEHVATMNEVMLEGIFIKSDNRTEYSDALNNFSQANKEMIDLLDALSPGGPYGTKFGDMQNINNRTLQNQNSLNSAMVSINAKVKDIIVHFRDSCNAIIAVYRGFFDDTRDGEHETLQNWMSIKGHDNRIWRDRLYDIYVTLQRCIFYIQELEPIDVSS